MQWLLTIIAAIVGVLIGFRYRFHALIAASLAVALAAAALCVMADKSLGYFALFTFAQLIVLQVAYLLGLYLSQRAA